MSERLIIAGGPRTGKTTMANMLAADRGCTLFQSDALVTDHEWSEASAAMAQWFYLPGPWIVEGVAAARALRKWLAQEEHGTPADRILLLRTPLVPRTAGQRAMAKGCDTVWAEIEPELRRRGVTLSTWKPETDVEADAVIDALDRARRPRAKEADESRESQNKDDRDLADDLWFR